MAYLRIGEARAVGQATRGYAQKGASQILREEAQAFSAEMTYDVFLSHSYKDADVILGVKRIMESLGMKVYVDWIEDPQLDRQNVNRHTASVVRVRMRSSLSLVYAHSPNAIDSNWMPWELGYFDGFKPHFVWILPLVVQYDAEFKGQEYLNLYPTVEDLRNVAGRFNLGFTDVKLGDRRRDLPLVEAVKEQRGVFFTG